MDGWVCDICNKYFAPSIAGWNCTCKEEGFDVCDDCYDKKDARIVIKIII